MVLRAGERVRLPADGSPLGLVRGCRDHIPMCHEDQGVCGPGTPPAEQQAGGIHDLVIQPLVDEWVEPGHELRERLEIRGDGGLLRLTVQGGDGAETDQLGQAVAGAGPGCDGGYRHAGQGIPKVPAGSRAGTVTSGFCPA
ncbi:hypothetical protein ACFFX0_07610 [Citricoccus parietis]|uniref:Uncharacterized protein n=1 Tax=Citricoccus parietis TaxID=592307 RepID=A0ABV5FWP4_9MICC